MAKRSSQDDESDDLGEVEFGISQDDDAGEPPPMPGPTSEPAVPPSDALKAIGPPPEGALAAASWAHRLLMFQAYETMMSPMPETLRRKEVRTILRDAAKHMTDAARYDYTKMRERDEANLANKKRGSAAAKAEQVAKPPAGARVIPIRRDA